MKKILLLAFLVTTLLILSFQWILPSQPSVAASPSIYQDRIKGATLIIVVESIQHNRVTLGYGMGTLVQYQGESYLVTHNHYGDLLQDMNLLELRDAGHRLIRTIYGYEFKSLTIYHDAGTLVLRVPDRVEAALTPVDLEDALQLRKGDIVQVARLVQPERKHVKILEAVIEQVGVSEQEPVYLLRSLNGELLSPGDSGGGVWHAGKLVANTWAVLYGYSALDSSGNADPDSKMLTDMSYAAIFPEIFKNMAVDEVR